jgi:DNA-binding HxlR family transcriptional regulator
MNHPDGYSENEQALQSYLESKGTIEVIVEIGTGTRSFDEIQDAVLISSTTASKRLKKGVELNLIRVTSLPTDHGTQKRYELTGSGRLAYRWAEELRIDEVVERRQRVEREFKNLRSQWIGRVFRSESVRKSVIDSLSAGLQSSADSSDMDLSRKQIEQYVRKRRALEEDQLDLDGESTVERDNDDASK